MKNIFILLLFIFAVSLESTGYPLPILLILVIVSSTYFIESQANLLAFFAGIAMDIFRGNNFGYHGLFFLIVLAILNIYKKKLYGGRMVYRLVFIVMLISIYYLVFYRSLNWFNILLSLILTIFFYFLFEKIFVTVNSKKRLTLN